MQRNHVVLTILLSIFILPLLMSCQKDDDHFEVIIFSSLPESSLEEMKGFAASALGNGTNFNIKIYPPVVERLIVEVVDHSGDILMMDRELLSSIYDSEGLYQLDELRNKENAIELNEFEQEALLADGEVTEETDIYPNALRVVNYAPFTLIHREVNEEPLEIVAVIPKYTDYEEVSFDVLKKLVQE